MQVNVIKFKSGLILLWLSEARNRGKGTRAGCCEDYRVPAISIYTLFTFGWLMLQKRPECLFFSNEKEILQNLHLTKNKVALKVHVGMQIFLSKSSSHSPSLFCLPVQI